MNRESRFINKDNFDDPNDVVLAGSIEEYDMLMEWDRCDLVELIQKLDVECEKLLKKIKNKKT